MIKTYKCYHDFHNYILIFFHLLSSIDTAIKGLHNQLGQVVVDSKYNVHSTIIPGMYFFCIHICMNNLHAKAASMVPCTYLLKLNINTYTLYIYMCIIIDSNK